MSISRWRDPTLDEFATLSETDITRRNFDDRNVTVGFFYVAFATVSSVFFVGFALAGGHGLLMRAVTIANFLVAAAGVRSLSHIRKMIRSKGELPLQGLARLLEANPTPFVIGFFACQFGISLLMAETTGGAGAWSMTLPWVVAAFRLTVARRAMLHLALVAMAIARLELMAEPAGPERGVYVALFFINAGSLGAGAASTRRSRSEWLARFNERRIHAVDQLRMRDELLYARRVQESLLPSAPPKFAGLDIGALALPATEVGGDYWDCLPVGEKVAFVSADVAGHGLASGIVLASLRAGVRLLRETLDRPEELMIRLHELLADSSGQRLLVTAALAVLDPRSGALRVANAAHPPLLLRRADGTVEWIDLPAPPLGVRLPFAPATADFVLYPGDLLLLHSDGAYEAIDSNDEAFGLERLGHYVAEFGGAGSADDVCKGIAARVAEHRGDRPQLDDLTLVAVRRLAADPVRTAADVKPV